MNCNARILCEIHGQDNGPMPPLIAAGPRLIFQDHLRWGVRAPPLPVQGFLAWTFASESWEVNRLTVQFGVFAGLEVVRYADYKPFRADP